MKNAYPADGSERSEGLTVFTGKLESAAVLDLCAGADGRPQGVNFQAAIFGRLLL